MDHLLTKREGPISIFTLNRPERMNALTPDLAADLRNEVAAFSADPKQKVLIITGAGDKAFSSGADLKRMGGEGGPRRLPITASFDLCDVGACEKPVIAAINGLAVGGGFELSLQCDIRLCAEDAWFALPEPSRGFIAGVAAMILPRLLPQGVVLDLMLAGERLTAERALHFGLVQAVLPRASLMDEAMRKAELICSASPSALWGTKKVVRFWRDVLLPEQLRYYEAVVHRVLLSGDMFEGIDAFREKRKPQFSEGWPDPFERLG